MVAACLLNTPAGVNAQLASLSRCSAVTTAFARASTATYTDVAGIIQTAQPNVLRNQHYVLGVLQPPLIEPVATNSALWPRDLSGASWSNSSGGTGTPNQNAVGLDGTANSATTISDTDATAFYDRTQTWAVPNDGNTHTVAVWIRKDANQARFPEISMALSGGTIQNNKVQLNTQTGVATLRAQTGAHFFSVTDLGLWWVLNVGVINNATGNTLLTLNVYPARTGVVGTTNVATTGSIVVGMVDLRFNSATVDSPIFGVGAGPFARAADVDQMLAATLTGYTRQIGSFLDEGFAPGMLATPAVFASDPVSLITDVIDQAITVSDSRSAETAVAGRSLSGLDTAPTPVATILNPADKNIKLQEGESKLPALVVNCREPAQMQGYAATSIRRGSCTVTVTYVAQGGTSAENWRDADYTLRAAAKAIHAKLWTGNGSDTARKRNSIAIESSPTMTIGPTDQESNAGVAVAELNINFNVRDLSP